MFKSEMYKYTLVKTVSFMSGFMVNKYYNHGCFTEELVISFW